MKKQLAARNRKARFDYRTLEDRRLLAGDVLFFAQGNFLRVVGDADDNIVEISQNDSGQTVVTGIDTTVNGLTAPQVLDSAEFLTVVLNEGSDDVALRDLAIENTVRVLGGDGDDRIEAEEFNSRFLHVEGDDGNDIVQLTDSAIEHSAYVFLDDGDDLLAVDSFSTGRNFRVFGNDGNDTFASGELTVGRKFRINTGSGDDNVLLTDETEVARSTKIRTGRGDDFVGALPGQNNASANFEGRFSVSTGSGIDSTALDASVSLEDSVRLRGGGGSDFVQFPVAIEAEPRIRGFEATSVDNLQALIDGVFSTLEDADISLGVDDISPEIGLTATGSALQFSEGSDSIAVDSGILLDASGDQEFSSASFSIEGFDSSQDVLSFTDSNGITGDFDDVVGVLSLTGTADAAAYQQALRSVFYQNTSLNPITDVRQINVSVLTDTLEEFTVSRSLEVIADDSLAVALSNSTLSVAQNATPVILDEQLEISGTDSTQIGSAVVAITSGFESGIDQLAFVPQAGIIGTFDPFSGALTFSGLASVEQYETILRSVTFDLNTDPLELERTIQFTVNDGESSSFGELELELV